MLQFDLVTNLVLYTLTFHFLVLKQMTVFSLGLYNLDSCVSWV